MAKKTPTPTEENAKLLAPRAQVAGEIEKQLSIGLELLERPIHTEVDFQSTKNDRSAWKDYTIELLRRRFSNRSMANEFDPPYFFGIGLDSAPLSVEAARLRDNIRTEVLALQRIHGKLELIEEAPGISARDERVAASSALGSKVFLVHGQNRGLREEVARLLERLDLDVVILHEQPNRGRTLIEKFEGNASNAGYAVVIASADDHGASIMSNDLKPRARQNVVFEAGFFFGALGRGRTAILYEEGVELPTDIVGVVYIPMSGDWAIRLAKEIRDAGFAVDLNKL